MCAGGPPIKVLPAQTTGIVRSVGFQPAPGRSTAAPEDNSAAAGRKLTFVIVRRSLFCPASAGRSAAPINLRTGVYASRRRRRARRPTSVPRPAALSSLGSRAAVAFAPGSSLVFSLSLRDLHDEPLLSVSPRCTALSATKSPTTPCFFFGSTARTCRARVRCPPAPSVATRPRCSLLNV